MVAVTIVVTPEEVHAVKPGDHVLVRLDPRLSEEDARAIAERIGKSMALGSITVFLGGEGFDLQTLDEEQMRAAGWVRPPGWTG